MQVTSNSIITWPFLQQRLKISCSPLFLMTNISNVHYENIVSSIVLVDWYMVLALTFRECRVISDYMMRSVASCTLVQYSHTPPLADRRVTSFMQSSNFSGVVSSTLTCYSMWDHMYCSLFILFNSERRL